VQKKIEVMQDAHRYELTQVQAEQATRYASNQRKLEQTMNEQRAEEQREMSRQLRAEQTRREQVTMELKAAKEALELKQLENTALQSQLATLHTKFNEVQTQLNMGKEVEKNMTKRQQRLEDQLAHAVRMMLKV